MRRAALSLALIAGLAIAAGAASGGLEGSQRSAPGALHSRSPGCRALPSSDELRTKVNDRPVHPRSRQIIARIDSIGGDHLHPDFGSRREWGIPYVVVGHDQRRVPVKFTAYGSESDQGPHPIPPDAPIEGGKRSDGDRHVLVLSKPRRAGGECKLIELYRAFYLGGSRQSWSADAAARFDLGSELPQRPLGDTSADAAGLPIYPALVRYPEVKRGRITHALRVTFERTRREYILPATHYASESCNPNDPPMGLRLRLEAGYGLSGFSRPARVIAEALKAYGMVVADNGSNWFISGATDSRWDDGRLGDLKRIPSRAFEVVSSPGRSYSDC